LIKLSFLLFILLVSDLQVKSSKWMKNERGKKHMFKHFITILMVLGLIVGSTSLVTAANIPVNLVDGDWQNAVPSVTINNSGASGGLSTARWGTSTGQGQSGYDFLSRTTPFNATSDGVVFALGDFTHQNYPIQGTSLSTIDLFFNLGIAALPTITATFNFTHEETPNSPPCAYPGDPACSDRVTMSNLILNQNFSYLGNDYYFSLLGFSQDGGTTTSDAFITWEGLRNTAGLYGAITEAPITTPEPATLVLLCSALLGLVGLRRKF
jgi:hypothetical protein